MAARWRDHAACRTADPGLFFGPDGESADTREAREAQARAVCARCPVKIDCLNFRLSQRSQDDGVIWAGLDGAERTRLLRNRRRAVRKPAAL